MKPPRSALTLPRYVLRKPLKSGWGYFFNVPIWARKAACPVKNEALGINYEVAVTRAETVLLPAFDDWRSGGASADAPTSMVAAPGTLDWVFASIVPIVASPNCLQRQDATTRPVLIWLATIS